MTKLIRRKASLVSTNPGKNYEVIGSVEASTTVEIKQKVTAAQAAKTSWKELGVAKRISLLWPVYETFLKRKKEIRDLIIKEIGKANQDVESEIDRYSENFKWFLENGEKYGFRNSQVTLLAPTGTIGFMMDVDCTGIEPMPGLKILKGLSG